MPWAQPQAEEARFGYAPSALLFGAAIALITIGFYMFKMNSILAFWLAYILTRPMGASIGDYLSQSARHGGLGLGTVRTSAVFIVAIALLVSYLTISHADAPDRKRE